MEASHASIIKSFLPDLVTAISDCVQPVSDQCLAKGLIPDSVYKRVLESGGTSDDKTRNLVLAMVKSTETDSRCFGIFLDVLEQVLPRGIKDALLSAMKKEVTMVTEQAKGSTSCMAVVTWGQNSQLTPLTQLTSGEVVKQQTSHFGKLEDAVRQHERACSEKKVLEESIKTKEEENRRLKKELDSLKQNQTTDSGLIGSIIISTEGRISAFESEMRELRGRIEELESLIEEQGMQVRRGRNAVRLGVVNLMSQLSVLAQKEITEVKQVSEEVLQEKEKELLAAKEKGRETEQRSLKELKEKDAKLQQAQREKEKAQEELRVKELEHRVALQEKDLKIKELELNYERRMSKQKESEQKKSTDTDHDDEEQDWRPATPVQQAVPESVEQIDGDLHHQVQVGHYHYIVHSSRTVTMVRDQYII